MRYFFITGEVGRRKFSLQVSALIFFREIDVKNKVNEVSKGAVIILDWKEITKLEYDCFIS